jgi:hypothetical protein
MTDRSFTALERTKFHYLVVALMLGITINRASAESRSAESFGIYLFAESEDWRDSASNWMTRALSPRPVISEADILTYNFTNHLMTLTPEAARRIAKFRTQRLIEPFAIVANGKRIYQGTFVSALCSQSVALPSITLWGSQQFTIYSNLPPNSLCIERTYAAQFSQAERDPRSDDRIMQALQMLHKLK